eukprot:snap_masked-scaffold_5-processed-gene-12.15-mRNA-1 protein AED:1.00 eAED:1.00 QI:0/0/0/0/1/1/2/0/60
MSRMTATKSEAIALVNVYINCSEFSLTLCSNFFVRLALSVKVKKYFSVVAIRSSFVLKIN